MVKKGKESGWVTTVVDHRLLPTIPSSLRTGYKPRKLPPKPKKSTCLSVLDDSKHEDLEQLRQYCAMWTAEKKAFEYAQKVQYEYARQVCSYWNKRAEECQYDEVMETYRDQELRRIGMYHDSPNYDGFRYCDSEYGDDLESFSSPSEDHYGMTHYEDPYATRTEYGCTYYAAPRRDYSQPTYSRSSSPNSSKISQCLSESSATSDTSSDIGKATEV